MTGFTSKLLAMSLLLVLDVVLHLHPKDGKNVSGCHRNIFACTKKQESPLGYNDRDVGVVLGMISGVVHDDKRGVCEVSQQLVFEPFDEVCYIEDIMIIPFVYLLLVLWTKRPNGTADISISLDGLGISSSTSFSSTS